MMQAPSKGSRPARLDMCDMLEEQKSQRTLFTEIEGLQSPITNPTFMQESDDKLDFDDERLVSALFLVIFLNIFPNVFFHRLCMNKDSTDTSF